LPAPATALLSIEISGNLRTAAVPVLTH